MLGCVGKGSLTGLDIGLPKADHATQLASSVFPICADDACASWTERLRNHVVVIGRAELPGRTVHGCIEMLVSMFRDRKCITANIAKSLSNVGPGNAASVAVERTTDLTCIAGARDRVGTATFRTARLSSPQSEVLPLPIVLPRPAAWNRVHSRESGANVRSLTAALLSNQAARSELRRHRVLPRRRELHERIAHGIE